MIQIKAPRYRDRRVLIARYKLCAGQDCKIRILYGAYKGDYLVRNSVIIKSPIEQMRTRNGAMIGMRAVPLDELERIQDEDTTEAVSAPI